MIKHPGEKVWEEKLFVMFGKKTRIQGAKDREIYPCCKLNINIWSEECQGSVKNQ